MAKVKIRTMAAPQVGDEYRMLDGEIMTDLRGFPVLAESGDHPALVACTTIARVADVGAYWSNQSEGVSGWYVEMQS